MLVYQYHARTYVYVVDKDLVALESSGDALAAVVDEEAEVDGHVEVDAQDVGLERRAEAHRRLQVGEAIDERAAGLLRRRAQHQVDEPVQHVRAHPQLQRIDRAPPSMSMSMSAPAPAWSTSAAATAAS